MALNDILADDFETGDPITTRWTRSGFGNPEVAAGVGRDGGYGVRCAGPSTAQSGRIRNTVAFSAATRTFVAQCDRWLPSTGLTAIGTPYWFDLINASGSGHILGFNITGASAPYDLTTEGYTGSGAVYSGVLPGDAWFTVRVEGILSTTPSSGDGELRIYVGTDASSLSLIHSETGLNFSDASFSYASFVVDRNGFLDNVDVGTGLSPVSSTAGFRLWIDAVDFTADIRRPPTGPFDEPEIIWERNVRARMTFDIEGNPAKRAEVLAYGKNGITPLFGGLVMRRPPVDVEPGAAYCTRVECTDFSTYLDWRYWTKTYATDKTMKEILTDLVSEKLSVYGITLDPAQVDGPTFTAPISFTRQRCSEVLRAIIEATGAPYIPRVDPLKVLKVFLPATEACPVDFDENDNIGRGMSWEDSEQVPATDVICLFGPNGIGSTPITQTWTADGVATVFSLQGLNVPAAVIPQSGDLWPGIVTVDGTPYPIFSPNNSPDPSNVIEWDAATNDGQLSFLGSFAAYVATPGSVISITYYPQFPFELTSSTGATTPVEEIIPYPDITDYALAVQTAAAALATRNRDPRLPKLNTTEDGCLPGQLAALNASQRDMASAEIILTRVSARLHTSEFWEYEIDAEEVLGTVAGLQADYLTAWRRITGTQSSTAGASVITAGGGGAGGGIVGPASSTDKAIARWNGASGNVLNDSIPIVADDGRITTVTDPVDPQDVATMGFAEGLLSRLPVLTADPASPSNNTFWVVGEGTSPTMTLALRARISGVTYTIGSVTL